MTFSDFGEKFQATLAANATDAVNAQVTYTASAGLGISEAVLVLSLTLALLGNGVLCLLRAQLASRGPVVAGLSILLGDTPAAAKWTWRQWLPAGGWLRILLVGLLLSGSGVAYLDKLSPYIVKSMTGPVYTGQVTIPAEFPASGAVFMKPRSRWTGLSHSFSLENQLPGARESVQFPGEFVQSEIHLVSISITPDVDPTKPWHSGENCTVPYVDSSDDPIPRTRYHPKFTQATKGNLIKITMELNYDEITSIMHLLPAIGITPADQSCLAQWQTYDGSIWVELSMESGLKWCHRNGCHQAIVAGYRGPMGEMYNYAELGRYVEVEFIQDFWMLGSRMAPSDAEGISRGEKMTGIQRVREALTSADLMMVQLLYWQGAFAQELMMWEVSGEELVVDRRFWAVVGVLLSFSLVCFALARYLTRRSGSYGLYLDAALRLQHIWPTHSGSCGGYAKGTREPTPFPFYLRQNPTGAPHIVSGAVTLDHATKSYVPASHQDLETAELFVPGLPKSVVRGGRTCSPPTSHDTWESAYRLIELLVIPGMWAREGRREVAPMRSRKM
ncbi:hypothetical protein K493DRAFT_305797 [Basidiobolus meristosporus CBS 931.73]|uniref:Uncharacterized protein n=1 Tax=Basidiobolus meristosporus CBS 931.73 TaxID=1314790 RepID=A0A1Y1XUL6_9FUNG|nr:hypothetical protein K493DRAFT_305797 [Basidiobolus meristosporus CBS 931.73]|eukprot:ORX89413.1 hypothetical protein K493DRAFT_305797 [Basidiobolus meristosporus CBS 931.73]